MHVKTRQRDKKPWLGSNRIWSWGGLGHRVEGTRSACASLNAGRSHGPEHRKQNGDVRRGLEKTLRMVWCVRQLVVYLVRCERDQNADASRQSGVDQGLWTSGNQRGLLERQNRFPHVVVHNHLGLQTPWRREGNGHPIVVRSLQLLSLLNNTSFSFWIAKWTRFFLRERKSKVP